MFISQVDLIYGVPSFSKLLIQLSCRGSETIESHAIWLHLTVFVLSVSGLPFDSFISGKEQLSPGDVPLR